MPAAPTALRFDPTPALAACLVGLLAAPSPAAAAGSGADGSTGRSTAESQPSKGPSTGKDSSDDGSGDGERTAPTDWDRTYRPQGDPISTRRNAPDLDGIADSKPTVGEVLLYIPRTVFFPVYLATNYLVRWPLDKLFTAIERHHVVEYVIAGLTFADRNAGFMPLIDVGGDRASSYGLRFFYDDLAGGRLDLDAGFQGMPRRNWMGQFKMRLRLPEEWSEFRLRTGAKKRDDYVYYGVGPQSDQDRADARYTKRTFLGRLGWAFGGGDGSPGRGRLRFEVVDRKTSCSANLAADACGDDATFGTEDDRYPVQTPRIAGLKQNYTFLRGGFGFYWDTRPPHPGSGVRVQSAATVGRAVEESSLQTLRLESEWAGYLELPGTYRRIIGLRLRAESAAPFEGGKIPVDELVNLGGVEKMRGFRQGRFRGRSLLLTTLNYRYPVWSFFDGQVFVEAGGLTGLYWNQVDLGDMRASAGLALRSKNMRSRQSSYTFNVAVGSSRFDRRFRIEEVRVNFGTNWGF